MADLCACGCPADRHRMGRGSCKDCPRFDCEAFDPLTAAVYAEHFPVELLTTVVAPVETFDATEEVGTDGRLTDVVPVGVASTGRAVGERPDTPAEQGPPMTQELRLAACRRCHHPASVHELVHGRRALVLRCLSCPDGSFCAFRRAGALSDVEEG